MPMARVPSSDHKIGKVKSATSPSTTKVVQKTLRCIFLFYRAQWHYRRPKSKLFRSKPRAKRSAVPPFLHPEDTEKQTTQRRNGKRRSGRTEARPLRDEPGKSSGNAGRTMVRSCSCQVL